MINCQRLLVDLRLPTGNNFMKINQWFKITNFLFKYFRFKMIIGAAIF